MVRNSPEPGGRDHFSCSVGAWQLMLDVGKAFGWKSLGTRYVPGNMATFCDSPATRHGYRPGDVRDKKLVDALDALEWARALSAARTAPRLSDMIGDGPPITALRHPATAEAVRSANAPFTTTMDEFIEYAFNGEFEFYGS